MKITNENNLQHIIPRNTVTCQLWTDQADDHGQHYDWKINILLFLIEKVVYSIDKLSRDIVSLKDY